jgi:hypothetical protein
MLLAQLRMDVVAARRPAVNRASASPAPMGQLEPARHASGWRQRTAAAERYQ